MSGAVGFQMGALRSVAQVFDSLGQDLRFAWRLVQRRPSVTLAALLTIGFGIGANTAIGSALEVALLNPLGLHGTERVMAATVRIDKIQMRHSSVSGVEFRELQAMGDVFSAAAAVEARAWTSLAGGEAVRLVGRAVTPDFFRVFDQVPARGRFFQPEEQDVVVLSHALWRSQFGRDSGVLGRVMVLDDKPCRIVGVAPESFGFPSDARLWTPLVLSPGRLRQRGYNMNLALFVRLKEGIAPAQAVARVNSYVAGLKASDNPEGRELADMGYGIELDTFASYVAGDLRQPLWLLWAATIALLLTGCANIGGLLLSRAAGRRREMAIRIALGAERLKIIRQLLVESLLLGALGGFAGLLMASRTITLLNRAAVEHWRILAAATLNWTALLYGFLLALASGLVAGLAPAIELASESHSSALARTRRLRFQPLFVTAQVGSALLLVVVTSLLLRSLWAVEQLQPGFEARNLTTAFFSIPGNDPGFADRLLAELRSLPPVESAALAYPLPFAGGGLTSGFSIRNRQRFPGEPEWHGEAYMVSPGYLRVLRIPLLRGRDVLESDSVEAPTVCLVDAEFAERYFQGQDPLGQEIEMFKGWARIVGVVGVIRDTALEETSRPTVYYPLPQVPYFSQSAIVVRSPAPAGLVVREAVRRTNASVPIFDMRSMEERIGASLGIRRMMALLLSVFGLVTLSLAAIGIYGVVAQVVSERTQEVGIRMTLGARPTRIVLRFMVQGLSYGFLGVIAGLAAAAYFQTWLTAFMYRVKPFDAASFCLSVVGVLSVLLIAIWWPARRASNVDPHEALRSE